MKSKRKKHLYPEAYKFINWVKEQKLRIEQKEHRDKLNSCLLFGGTSDWKPELVVTLPRNKDGSKINSPLVVKPNKLIRDFIEINKLPDGWLKKTIADTLGSDPLAINRDFFNVWTSRETVTETLSVDPKRINHKQIKFLPDGSVNFLNKKDIEKNDWFMDLGILIDKNNLNNKVVYCKSKVNNTDVVWEYLRTLIKQLSNNSITTTIPKQSVGKMSNTSSGIHPTKTNSIASKVSELPHLFGSDSNSCIDCKSKIHYNLLNLKGLVNE